MHSIESIRIICGDRSHGVTVIAGLALNGTTGSDRMATDEYTETGE
jgi:hypothetical protein